MKKRKKKPKSKRKKSEKNPRKNNSMKKPKENTSIEKGPIVVENNLNRFTTYSFSDWKEILKYEKKENLSNSILINSLRQGIPFELRPRIWAFLSDLGEIVERVKI